jgi:hypothetical protein
MFGIHGLLNRAIISSRLDATQEGDSLDCCEVCKTTTDKGTLYQFYYGKRRHSEIINKERRGLSTYTTTATHYHLAGQKSVYLCHRCVLRQVQETNFLVGLSTLCISLVALIVNLVFFKGNINTPSDERVVLMLDLLFMVLPFIVSLFTLTAAIQASLRLIQNSFKPVFRRPDWLISQIPDPSYEVVGDQMAIKLYKSELVDQEFNSFFTRAERRKLR